MASRDNGSASKKGLLSDFLNKVENAEELFMKDNLSKLEDINFMLRLQYIRELDLFHMATDQEKHDHAEVMTRITHGAPILLRKLWGKDIDKHGTFPTYKEISMIANHMSSYLGLVGEARKLAQICADGLCLLTFENGRYNFLFPTFIDGDERYEVKNSKRIINKFNKKGLPQYLKRILADTREKIAKKQSKMVYCWEKFYIGYSGTPEIDNYYFAAAYRSLYYLFDFDAFDNNDYFGGVKFNKYKMTLTFLLSLSYKHEVFCLELKKKRPDLDFRDILTISVEIKPFMQDCVDAVNNWSYLFEENEDTTLEEMKIIFDVLTLRKENIDMIKDSKSLLPPLFKWDDICLIKPTSTIRIDPFIFLVKSLKFHFPKDYDKAQNFREKRFQDAIEATFVNKSNYFLFRRNVKIKLHKNIATDIDLVVYDVLNNELGLFQLKWQDNYGYDVFRRRTKRDNLVKECSKWIEVMEGWDKEKKAKELSSLLQIKQNIISEAKIKAFVLCKHYSHFLSCLALPDNYCYGSFLSFIDIMEKSKKPIISDVFKKMMDARPCVKSKPIYLSDEEEVKQLPNLDFSIKIIGKG